MARQLFKVPSRATKEEDKRLIRSTQDKRKTGAVVISSGNSLSDKMLLKNLLNLKGCAGEYLRKQTNIDALNNITTKSVIENITSTKNTTASNQIMTELRNSDPISTSRATSTMMVSSENVSAIHTKTDTIQSSYYYGISSETKNNKLDNIYPLIL